jgi:hypothetical protein
MEDLDDEAAYLLDRAKQEERQAAAAGHPKASDAHRALSQRYATRAFMAQLDAGEAGPTDK